jgi:hypothetical protein
VIDRREHWATLERGLTALAQTIGLGEKDRAEVIHYISHREYGLSLEHMCLRIRERACEITSSQYEAMLSLQDMMGMTGIAESVCALRDQ